MAIYTMKAITSLGVVSALAVGGSAVTQKAIARTPTHAIKGIVKSISAFYLAIVTGSGKKAHEVTLALNPDTERDGEITIGATVSVRYRMEGRTFVATAVAAHADRQRAPQLPRR